MAQLGRVPAAYGGRGRALAAGAVSVCRLFHSPQRPRRPSTESLHMEQGAGQDRQGRDGASAHGPEHSAGAPRSAQS